ncbi:MAG: hypothetical protein Q9183_007217 [Haloplaca sp. 2 TL-2023]
MAATFDDGEGEGLFRWCHLENKIPSVDEFMKHVCESTLLDRSQSRHAVGLLRQVQKEHEHQVPATRGSDGRYLDANLSEKPIEPTQQEGVSRVLFVAIPYFHFTANDTRQLSSTPDSHPLRSLLQLRFPSVTFKREMQQAVCQLRNLKSGEYFHIPQIWFLVIDNRKPIIDEN